MDTQLRETLKNKKRVIVKSVLHLFYMKRPEN